MSAFPPPSAFQGALRMQQGALSNAYPGTVEIAGATILNAAVVLSNVMLEQDGGGTVEKRSITVVFDKKKLAQAPVIGSVIVHQDLRYVLNQFDGREAWDTSWKVIGIELDRTGK